MKPKFLNLNTLSKIQYKLMQDQIYQWKSLKANKENSFLEKNKNSKQPYKSW